MPRREGNATFGLYQRRAAREKWAGKRAAFSGTMTRRRESMSRTPPTSSIFL